MNGSSQVMMSAKTTYIAVQEYRETQFDTHGKITSLGKLKKRVVMIQAAATELLQWSL